MNIKLTPAETKKLKGYKVPIWRMSDEGPDEGSERDKEIVKFVCGLVHRALESEG